MKKNIARFVVLGLFVIVIALVCSKVSHIENKMTAQEQHVFDSTYKVAIHDSLLFYGEYMRHISSLNHIKQKLLTATPQQRKRLFDDSVMWDSNAFQANKFLTETRNEITALLLKSHPTASP